MTDEPDDPENASDAGSTDGAETGRTDEAETGQPDGADAPASADDHDAPAETDEADPPESAAAGAAADEWQDLHPLTALLDALQWGLNAGAFGFFAGAVGGGGAGVLPVESVFVLAPLAFLLGAGYGVASYLVFEYRLGSSALHITSGVFNRQNREIPLRRIQNVDVHQSFVARVLGLASVKLETAGGGGTEAELRLVTREEAERLQREIRRRKRGEGRRRKQGEGEAADERRPAAETGAETAERRPVGTPDEGTVLFELSTQDLLVLSGVSFRWGVLTLFLFGIPLVSDALTSVAVEVVGPDGMSPADPLVVALGLAGLVGLVLASWVVSAALTFVRYFDFQLRRIDDELLYERGLLQRYSGSIPLEKVQTLTVRENPLMRRLGYASLLVETAGYTPGQGSDGQQVPSAVPLAAREDVEAFAADLEGVEDFSVERPPKRARRRYAIRYGLVVLALSAALFAVDRVLFSLPWYAALAGLALAPVAAHLKWVNRGFGLGDTHLVTRTGFWRRSTQLVPYYRIQNVVTERTYFQRRWRLASVVADTASSAVLLSRPPTAHDVDDERAERLHGTLRERLQESLRERRAGRFDDEMSGREE